MKFRIGLQFVFDRSIERSCPVALISQALVSLLRDTVYSVKPIASSIDGDVGVFDVNMSMSYACDISNRLNHISSRGSFERRRSMA